MTQIQNIQEKKDIISETIIPQPNVWHLLTMTVRNTNSNEQFKLHPKTWFFEYDYM